MGLMYTGQFSSIAPEKIAEQKKKKQKLNVAKINVPGSVQPHRQF